MKIRASGPITSWEIDGETAETVKSLCFFFGSKITADDDCSHEIKRRLLLGRKVKTNLDSILKSRDITLPTKVCLVKAIFFFFLKGGTLLSVYLFIYLLYNIILVLPYINMHLPQVYTCSQSWIPLPPPSPYHPSGSSQCTSPKLPVSCVEPEWRFISYMILYMF